MDWMGVTVGAICLHCEMKIGLCGELIRLLAGVKLTERLSSGELSIWKDRMRGLWALRNTVEDIVNTDYHKVGAEVRLLPGFGDVSDAALLLCRWSGFNAAGKPLAKPDERLSKSGSQQTSQAPWG
jgi:hypothetical protein